MKNIFGMYTSEDDEREYEASLEKDLEKNSKLKINKKDFKSKDAFLNIDTLQAKKFQG